MFALLAQSAALVEVASVPEPLGIEDFSDSLRHNDLAGALLAVDTIFEDKSAAGLAPLMLGMLAGRAAYVRDKAQKARLLGFVWDADRGIKEKGLDPRMTIETLLIKLFKL